MLGRRKAEWLAGIHNDTLQDARVCQTVATPSDSMVCRFKSCHSHLIDRPSVKHYSLVAYLSSLEWNVIPGFHLLRLHAGFRAGHFSLSFLPIDSRP